MPFYSIPLGILVAVRQFLRYRCSHRGVGRLSQRRRGSALVILLSYVSALQAAERDRELELSVAGISVPPPPPEARSTTQEEEQARTRSHRNTKTPAQNAEIHVGLAC